MQVERRGLGRGPRAPGRGHSVEQVDAKHMQGDDGHQ
jgi:hypothetical protein